MRTILAITITGLLLIPGLAHAGGFKLFKMSKKQELSIAKDLNEEIAKEPGLITEGKLYDQVQRVGNRIVEKNGLEEYDYRFFLVNDDEVNAFATPAGYIYMNKGLVDLMGYDESMLASVMAHELGHAKDRHVAKAYEKQMEGAAGLTLLGLLAGNNNQDYVDILGGVGVAMYLKYNRDQEEWADRDGVDLSYTAGYDAYGMMRGLQCLEQLHGSAGDIAVYLQNHPSTDDRVSRTRKIALDTSGKEHGYMKIPVPPNKEHPLWALYGTGGGAEGAIGTAESYTREKKTSPAPPSKSTSEK